MKTIFFCNVFMQLLKQLRVKHTPLFVKKLIDEHPNSSNLLGFSQLLSEYNVKSRWVKANDKASFDVSTIATPFVAQMQSGFVVASSVTANEVSYLQNGRTKRIAMEQFKEGWTGVALLTATNKQSIEPGYKQNQITSLFGFLKRYILLTSLAVALAYAFLINQLYSQLGLLLAIAVNTLGVYISYLLVLKQLDIHSGFAEKLCSAFKKNSCDSVLNTSASKLFGVVGWSEIGLGYFTANVLALLVFPQLIPYLALVNIAGLPYSFWSVWYQKTVAKSWCTMCLIVQLLLWLFFIVNLVFGYVCLPNF